jgi:hypothetical protein
MKNRVPGFKILIFLAVILIAGGIFSFSSTVHSATGTYDYTQLEKIPGSENAGSDLKSFIESIYKFGIWTVGIAAVLMITIGGFMYLASAGNTSKMDTAKNVITNAIIGLVVALSAYLILYVINPDLVNINISMKQGATSTTEKAGTTGKTGTGTCKAVTTGACSVENLKTTCFSSNPEVWSKICNQESRGNPAYASGTDLCADGQSFSIGLFQINMFNSAESIGCNGSEIFSKTGSGPQGDCLEYKTNSNNVKYCAKRNCKVKNQSAYNACRGKLENSQTNLQAACSLSSNGTKYSPWSTSAGICGTN